MDLTQMFLASPDWVKAMWVLCMTGLVLGFPAVCALLVKTLRQPAAAGGTSGPVVTLLPTPQPNGQIAPPSSGLLEAGTDRSQTKPEEAPNPAIASIEKK